MSMYVVDKHGTWWDGASKLREMLWVLIGPMGRVGAQPNVVDRSQQVEVPP